MSRYKRQLLKLETLKKQTSKLHSEATDLDIKGHLFSSIESLQGAINVVKLLSKKAEVNQMDLFNL